MRCGATLGFALVLAAPAVAEVGTPVVFTGMCDASGAVALTGSLFVMADDEGNVLRVYDALRGGAPLASVDVSAGLGVLRPPKRARPDEPRPPLETDIEAGARVGNVAFWITSHGRNSAGKLRPERLRFFATTAPPGASGLELVGAPYERLLDDLLADPRFQRFGLAEASLLAPKAPGGLNVEGMTERLGGGVLIGLRGPTPGGRALVFPLLNPEELVQGQSARFGDPLLLDLGGYGVRALSWWRGQYLILGGHHASGATSRLYTWDGSGSPVLVDRADLAAANPEGFFTPEDRDEFMLLSDDGSAVVDGAPCKRLEDPSRKTFRGYWLALK
jgi:hypothetical protein